MWQPDLQLESLIKFVSAGIPPDLLKALILRVALKEDSPSTTLKAVEMLWGMAGDDTDSSGSMDWNDAQRITRIVESVFGSESDDVRAVLNDIGRELQSNPEEVLGPDVTSFLTRISSQRTAHLPFRPTQSDDNERPDPGGSRQDSPPDN